MAALQEHTIPASSAGLRPPDESGDCVVDEHAGLVPAKPVSRPGAPRQPGAPRSLGERLDREQRALRAKIYDLKTQLQAARHELDELHGDGWADVRRSLVREAQALGIDQRRTSRDLLGHLLADRTNRSTQAAVDRDLVAQLRNTLYLLKAGEITAADAQQTLWSALGWRDEQVVAHEAARTKLHPGPAKHPCPECGRERGQWADDCTTCAKSSAEWLGAQQ